MITGKIMIKEEDSLTADEKNWLKRQVNTSTGRLPIEKKLMKLRL